MKLVKQSELRKPVRKLRKIDSHTPMDQTQFASSPDDLILLDDEGESLGYVRVDDSSYGRKWGSYQLHLQGDFYPTTHRSTKGMFAYARERSAA